MIRQTAGMNNQKIVISSHNTSHKFSLIPPRIRNNRKISSQHLKNGSRVVGFTPKVACTDRGKEGITLIRRSTEELPMNEYGLRTNNSLLCVTA
jgi:hypothetical protein